MSTGPTDTDELVETMTKAMAVALREDSTSFDGVCYAYTLDAMCPHEGGWATEVDGEFDLAVLARAALEASGIAELQAEIAGLRSALGKIATHNYPSALYCHEIARTALNRKPSKIGEGE